MDVQLLFEIEKGKYRVPESADLYLKNFDYFKGMGLYDEMACREKALITTGYYIVQDHEHNL